MLFWTKNARAFSQGKKSRRAFQSSIVKNKRRVKSVLCLETRVVVHSFCRCLLTDTNIVSIRSLGKHSSGRLIRKYKVCETSWSLVFLLWMHIHGESFCLPKESSKTSNGIFQPLNIVRVKYFHIIFFHENTLRT